MEKVKAEEWVNSNCHGSGDGIKTFNNYDVFIIDGIQTIITNIMGSYAKGLIIESDLNLKPCYIAKGKGLFAHGDTLRKANKDLQNKIMQNLDIDEKIQIVIGKYEHGKAYPTKELYDLHNFLTGSCDMGRMQFAKDHNIDLDGEMTMDEFIDLTEEAYGGDVIKQLKEEWEEQKQ